MEPVDYRAVICSFVFVFCFFNSNGRTAQGTVNEVNAIYGEDAPHMTLLNIGIASSSESEICGNGFYPSATPVCHWWEDCQTECAVWKIVVSSFVSELNMSRSVLDLLTKYFMAICIQEETWIHHYDPDTNALSKKWKHFDSQKRHVIPLQSYGTSMELCWWYPGKRY